MIIIYRYYYFSVGRDGDFTFSEYSNQVMKISLFQNIQISHEDFTFSEYSYQS